MHSMVYVSDLFLNALHSKMDHHTRLSRQNSSVKTLFDNITSKKSSESNDLTHDFVDGDVLTTASIDVTYYSSARVERNNEAKKDQDTSTDPILNHQQLEEVRKCFICYRLD